MTLKISDLEASRFFMVAGNMTAAKKAKDIIAIAEWADELEALAVCGGRTVSYRAASALTDAQDCLRTLQAERLGIPGAYHLVQVGIIDLPANDGWC